MKTDLLEALKQIAILGGARHSIEISSKTLGKILGVSQQTASKRLIDLERAGAIKRSMSVKKQRIVLTDTGLQELRREYLGYRRIFEEDNRVYISGKAMSGLGEGRYYMMQKGYIDQFRERLGFIPYPGTLNIDLDEGEASKLQILDASPGILISGFQSGERTFGDVKCFKAKIKDIECAAIIPKRTHHRRTIEVVAEESLRRLMDIKDGNIVELVIEI